MNKAQRWIEQELLPFIGNLSAQEYPTGSLFMGPSIYQQVHEFVYRNRHHWHETEPVTKERDNE